MLRLPPRSTRTDTLFPYTSRFRSLATTQGQVFFRGQEITGIGVTAVCQLGMSKSYQINQLFEALTVRQNATIPVLARSRGKFRTDMLRSLHNSEGLDEQVNAAIELVGDRKSTRLNSSH